MNAPPPSLPPTLRCAGCGERLRPGRAPGTWSHVPRLVAACDLDSDHPVVPDWAAAGPLRCAVCGEPLVVRDGAPVHAEGARDADHAPEPVAG